jgi:threonine dehydrogenase-like Zn-dependent dehydrogenase
VTPGEAHGANAAEAAEVALAAGPGWVDVLGDGDLAESIRTRLGTRAAGESKPGAVVKTSGEPDAIADALKRVADLGTVVLAGPPPADAGTLDLYADLHVRGLTVVGIATTTEASPR